MFIPKIKPIEFESNPSPWEEYAIADFSGGLCTSQSEVNIRDNQFSQLTNYYIKDDNSLKVRGPWRPYNVDSCETVLATAPLSFRIIELGATGPPYILACSNSGTDVSSLSTSTWTTVVTLSSANPVEYVKYSVNDAEDIIFCNGNDIPQRWTGSGVSTNLGLDVPSAANLTDNSSVSGTAGTRGLLHTGDYYYKFTYFYDDSGTSTKYGESGASSVSPAIAITASTSEPAVAKLAGVPSPPAGVTKTNIYRAPCGEDNGPFNYVGYIATGTTFDDTMPDGEEGDEIPLDAGTPPRLKHPLEAHGRLWGAGLNSSGELKNKGVYSEKGQPDMFLAANYYYFPDEYIGPVEFNRNIYHFTTKEIYVTPNGDVEAYPEPLRICKKGCTSYRSIVDVGNGLVFQGEDNIYWVDFNTQAEDGDFPIPIGEPIKDKIENIPVSYRTNSRAELYKDKYYLSYTGKNVTTNKLTLVWNIKHGTRLLTQGLFGAWSLYDWGANDLQNFEGTLYSADNLNKYIMEHDFAGSADYTSKTNYDAGTSTNISTQISTKKNHFGHEWAEKLIKSMSIVTKSSGVTYDASLSLENENTSSFTRIQSITLGSDTLATDSNWLIWDEGVWNDASDTYTTYWADESYFLRSAHKKFRDGAKGKTAQLSLNSENTQDTNLLLLKLYYKRLPSPT